MDGVFDTGLVFVVGGVLILIACLGWHFATHRVGKMKE